jgi:hypothetical protein
MKKMHCNLLSAYLQVRRLSSQPAIEQLRDQPTTATPINSVCRRQVQHASRYISSTERSSCQAQRRYEMSVRLPKRQPVEASSERFEADRHGMWVMPSAQDERQLDMYGMQHLLCPRNSQLQNSADKCVLPRRPFQCLEIVH